MVRLFFKRSLGVYLGLAAVAAGVSAWQWGEHRRFQQTAAQALINRGRDITSTLGVVINSQRRFGNLVAKDRMQLALQGLIHPGELESIAVLAATGEPIASAGRDVGLTPELIRAGSVHWRDQELILMNLVDLGVGTAPAEEHSPPATLVVTNQRMTKAFRTSAKNQAAGRQPAVEETGGGAAPSPRFLYTRPSWMEKEEYDELIKKQGVHSLLIALSTRTMRQAVRQDLLLRSLISLLACGGCLVSGMAWRNLVRNSELQLRLVKAGEMNSHLAQMNFAAAGLAHETRNPLNLIRGLAQLIAMETKASPKLQEHASTIVEEADRVTVQLNEFIDFSKPRQAHLAPVDLARLIADVARTLRVDVEDKQLQLVLPEATVLVSADEALLRQALFNLLLNAVQAVSAQGRIEVSWVAAGGAVTLEISDDGPGVPEAERVNIFKPYVTMRPKGVGLGLAIVQQIVAAHRWDILCTARPPHGATFRISHMAIVPSAS